ncbi:MAG: DNA/RNA nuclease SfsA [Anaerocolumna sp.]
MRYNNIKTGIFKARPNRFIAHIEVDGLLEICHVKNTGRCKELLIPGCTVYVEESDNKARKTRYSLIAVKKGERIINMDSQAPNKLVHEWLILGELFQDIRLIKPEKVYGNSRFDFYIETSNQKIFMEVKGVTLEEEGIVRFPDAPTERGIKHMKELMSCQEEGYEAYIIFVIQMKGAIKFEPNDFTHPEFGHTLRRAHHEGVHVLAYDCEVEPDCLSIRKAIPVIL